MKRKDPDHSYINHNGKRVSGTASVLHRIYTEEGGLKNHDENVAIAFFKKFLQANPDISSSVAREARKERFKKRSG